MPDLVKVNYARTGASTKTNTYGMREMQERAYAVAETGTLSVAVRQNGKELAVRRLTVVTAEEMYARGFEFMPIDLYKSDPVKFLIKDGKLLPPFVSVSGLGEAAAKDIVDHRKGVEFISVEELEMSCPKLSKAHIADLKALVDSFT